MRDIWHLIYNYQQNMKKKYNTNEEVNAKTTKMVNKLNEFISITYIYL
jgi:hypothetical protein